MNTRKAGIVSILFLLISLSANAADKIDIPILFNGNTAVNRHALQFLEQQFKAAGRPWHCNACTDPAKLKAGAGTTVILLNTGISSGIDPVLASYISSRDPSIRIILITLTKGSTEAKVETVSPLPASAGVDAVTAASAWSKSGFGKTSPYTEMHQQWASRVIALLSGAK